MEAKGVAVTVKFANNTIRPDWQTVWHKHPEIKVREVTDDELAFYYEHGWVKLEQLISEDAAALLLAEAERFATEAEDLPLPEESMKVMQAWASPSNTSDLFASFAFSPTLANNASRFMSDPYCGKRYARRSIDTVVRKWPESIGGKPTLWHQDFTSLPFDRGGMMIFWLALVPMGPEMGTMRFIDKSHRMGVFGRFNDFGLNALDLYPGIAEHGKVSPPLTLRAGDATVHDGLTLHSAPANQTERSRWVAQASYFPSETLYTGARSSRFDELELTVNEGFDHPLFPIIGDKPE